MADFCAAAVLISFGAVIGKASISQLIIMATIEVIVQSFNEYIGLEYLKVKKNFSVLILSLEDILFFFEN